MYFLTNFLDFGIFKQNSFEENKEWKEQHNDTNSVNNTDTEHLKTYTYAEAINRTGHGRYSLRLLALNSLALLSATLDMFGFSVVVSDSACDLKIGTTEKNILLSIPFIGTIISAYWWGYISDTRGRKLTINIAMWGSFIAATLGTLSPNWTSLAVFKLISVTFCSCAQSVTYTWLGESAPEKVKSIYYVILTTIMSTFGFPLYIIASYIFSTLDFSIDLYFICFVPWRLLALTLAIPLGICAVSCHYFHESPKFLINIGKEKLALDILKKIWTENGEMGTIYPVNKIILGEEGNVSTKNESLLKSLWDQTVPLFKRPLVLRTVQLFYLVITIFISCNSVIIWFPFIANALLNGISSLEKYTVRGLCDIIEHSQTNVSSEVSMLKSCESQTNATVAWTVAGRGLFILIVNLCSLKLAHRKKLLMIIFLAISSISCVGVGASNMLSFSVVLFYTVPITLCATGLVFSYFVDLFPTSYRGMAACLGVMVARFTGVFCVNVVGLFIISDCSTTFYLIAANLLGGVVVAFFLPPDIPK